MLSGGLGTTIDDVTSVQRYKDDPTLETEIECLAATIGYLALIGTANYILNRLPGYWQYIPQLGTFWRPISNLVYPQPAPQVCTTTVTSTQKETRVTNNPKITTCDGNKYPQACRHYSSVINVNQGLDTLVCPVESIEGSKRPITKVWNGEHNQAWLYWVPHLPGYKPGPKFGYTDKCNRDEYPPFAFLEADGANYAQWIRFLPGSENQGAGQLWKGVCKTPKSQVNPVQGGPINDKTCTEITSITYTVNAFVMSFTNIPAGDDGLAANPCLPEITDDPGWYFQRAFLVLRNFRAGRSFG